MTFTTGLCIQPVLKTSLKYIYIRPKPSFSLTPTPIVEGITTDSADVCAHGIGWVARTNIYTEFLVG